jgi:hypothetical protein
MRENDKYIQILKERDREILSEVVRQQDHIRGV